MQKDTQSLKDWPGSSFFSKSISKRLFSPDEIVKLTPLPAVYLLGGPLWHNACSPSTALLTLKQPGTLVWLSLFDDASKSALLGQDLFASQGLCWIYKISWVWEGVKLAQQLLPLFPSLRIQTKTLTLFPITCLQWRWLCFPCCLHAACLSSLAVLVTQYRHHPALCK